MKLAILTLPLHTNIGGILQLYALKTILRQAGNDVWVINRDLLPDPNSSSKIDQRDVDPRVPGGTNSVSAGTRAKRSNSLPANDKVGQFIEHHFPQHFRVPAPDNRSLPELDALVVGGDQVWRPKYFTQASRLPIDYAYLSFTRGWRVRRISYAASFGVSTWEYTRCATMTCSEYVQRFDAVSVRESSAVKLCREHFRTNAEWVLDPVFLLDWSASTSPTALTASDPAAGIAVASGFKVFNYVLDPDTNKEKIIEKIASKLGATFASSARVQTGANEPQNSDRNISVESWLKDIQAADLVVTDSYHVCVFSIIFQKPFFVIGETSRGMARFDSLLGLLGLNSRRIASMGELTDTTVFHEIDWQRIHNVLEIERERSMRFLITSLTDRPRTGETVT